MQRGELYRVLMLQVRGRRLASLSGPLCGVLCTLSLLARAGAETELVALTLSAASGEQQQFQVELALTPPQRSQALMHRPTLPARQGMLFLFPTPRPIRMWMVNTLISLDMLFFDRRGYIQQIHARATPGSRAIIGSRQPAWGVLELRGGSAARYGIAVGDRLLLKAIVAGAHIR